MSKEEIETFAEKVFDTLKIKGRMVWTKCSAGFANRNNGDILIPERMINKCPWEAKEYVLHETAHLLVEDYIHSEKFYEQYVRLLALFMVGLERSEGNISDI